MSTVTLRIAVDKAGASENIGAVKRDLQGMGETGAQAGQQAAGGVNGLSSAINGAKAAIGAFLAVYAGIQALSGVVRLADEYQGLTDRLKLATAESGGFAAAQAGVFAIAQQTGTALSAVGGLYVSLTNSTKALGLSQGELQTITQAVTQSFIVSGASASQTDAAIRQLGQGFSSGVLRGDEFNSMMENAPSLAAALAASIGVTTGELRAMAAEGKLTSDVLAQGLLQQAPAIAAQFDQMGTTVGQAFTRLSNSVLQFVGEASQSTGAASALAAAITAVANTLPGIAIGLAAVGAGLLAVKLNAIAASTVVFTMSGLFATLGAAIAAITVVYAAFKLGEYMADQFIEVRLAGAALIVGMNNVWEALRLGALAAFTAIRVAFVTVVDAVQEKIADLLQSFIDLGQFEIFGQSVDFTYGQAEALDTLVESLRGATDGAGATDAAMAGLKGEFDASAKASQDLADGLFEGVEAHFATKGAAEASAEATKKVGAAAALTKDQIKELKKAQEDATRAMDGLTKELERQSAEAGGPLVAAYVELAQKLRAVDEWEVQLRADQGLSRTEADLLRQARDGLTQGLVRTVTALNSTVSAEQQYLRELREEVRIAGLTGVERAAAITRIDAESTARRLLKGATEEQIKALTDEIVALQGQKKAADEAGAAAEEWARYWEGATDAVLDAFGGLFSGGIDSLEEFGDQMLQISQRIVSDIVKEFARTGQIRLPTGMFGAGGTGSTVGGWLSAIGTAYGALQNARNGGSALSTIGGFAVSGAQIAGPVGAAVGAIVGGLVAAFSGDNNPLLRVRSSEFSGPRRSEGRATSQLGNIFIRTENTPDGAGTSPEIAQRIADFDNLIASFLSADQLSAIRGALSNVNDTFENGAFTIENALNSRFGTILGALDSNIQEFVGTTGTLEQRVARLTDALTIASIAASDNGITGSFDDLATLLTRFRDGGEVLGDTFQRLSFGVRIVDSTLLMLGGTFNGTRLQAATFAGELIELAGGLDQFSARLNGALEALFTEPERNQFLASQAQAALNESLRGLNISGTGVDSIREQLRTQLRDALAAGNSALVNELLIAGNALGAFTTAVGRLGDEATGALSGVVLGGTSGTIRPGGGLTSPAGTAAQTQIQAVQTTNTILQTQTSILQQIAINTTRGTGLTPGASPKAGDPAAILARIEGLIEKSVRTQVTEALKRTTGANKRAATA